MLALFHEQLQDEGKHWRDITPAEARERMGRIARGLIASYRDGLLQASEQTRFMARILTESLQDFVETLVGWMRHQYRFDPVAVELALRRRRRFAGVELDLGNGPSVGTVRAGGPGGSMPARRNDEALCVVVDYKSSQKQLDPVLMAHGLQLQLLAYLNVLRHWPNPRAVFGVARLIPAGVFYVNLRGKYAREQTRRRRWPTLTRPASWPIGMPAASIPRAALSRRPGRGAPGRPIQLSPDQRRAGL